MLLLSFRQYLSNEGLGIGTPGQRQKQYQKFRAMRAAENVYEHRVGKLTAKYETRLVSEQQKNEQQTSRASKKHHTKNAIERLVEDLIVESMAKGDFDNLKGTGKPLPERVVYNPYEDFTTHKINEILVEGGFAPEWITLQRDIKLEKARIRELLSKKCRAVIKQHSANQKVNQEAAKEWRKYYEEVMFNSEEVKTLNKNIDKYNLMVPMLNGQMFHYNVIKESKNMFSALVERFQAGESIEDTVEPKDVFKSQQKHHQPTQRSSTIEPDKTWDTWSYILNEFRTYFNKTKAS